MRLVPVGVDPDLFQPVDGVAASARPPDHDRLRRRRTEGAGLPGRGDGQAPRRRPRHHADDHRQAEARQVDGPDRPVRPRAPHRLRVGRDRRADRRALLRGRTRGRTRACTRGSASRRSRRCAPARRWSRPTVAPSPRSPAPTARPSSAAARATPTISPGRSATRSPTPRHAARVGDAGRQRVLERWTWQRCAELTVEQYREVLAMPQNIQKLAANGRL